MVRVFSSRSFSALEEVGLDFSQSLADAADKFGTADTSFFARVAAGEEDAVFGDVFGPDLGTQRHAAFDVIPILFAAADIAVVDHHAHFAAGEVLSLQLLLE